MTFLVTGPTPTKEAGPSTLLFSITELLLMELFDEGAKIDEGLRSRLISCPEGCCSKRCTTANILLGKAFLLKLPGLGSLSF